MFIEAADYDKQIRSQVKAVLGDDTVFADAENAALAESRSYLNGKYDTTAIFSATGSNRNAILLTYVIDMALYHIHSRLSPQNVPQLRKDRYDKAIAWHRDVMKGTAVPDLPLASTETTPSAFRLGGTKKKYDDW